MLIADRRSTFERAALRSRFLAARARSTQLFGLFHDAAYEARPIPLRLPIAFYEGHVSAFTYNTLALRGLGKPSIDPCCEELFERGIDPKCLAEAEACGKAEWPARATVHAFAAAVDQAILRAYAFDDLDDASRSPLLERAQAAHAVLEHEEMHHETLLYILHRLPLAHKRTTGRGGAFVEAAPLVPNTRIAIPAGIATLGARRDTLAFGWDNEFDEHAVAVPSFEIDSLDVTNADWLAFVRDGGPLPPFWIERDGTYLLSGMFEELPLPSTWPVYVTQAQASAYATWRGSRLPTEAEYHRAAFGTPEGVERAHPWGDDAPQPGLHGNFDFARFEPEPVGVRPAGASAWGVHDLAGNGWEWTSTPFQPLPGFRAMASFPGYSADFFDGEHFVMKGASPVTNRRHLRRSFRNWFRVDYPYVYATFRTAAS